MLSMSHHFYAFETQISLWLATSALYRDIKLFEKARSSVNEAQCLVESLSRTEARIQSGTSRLFKEFPSRISSAKLTDQKSEKPAPGWNLSNLPVRRILADIALEVFLINKRSMIDYDIYFHKQKPTPAVKHHKYLTPIGRLEVERGVEQRKAERNFMRNSRSQNSFSSVQSSGNNTIDTSPDNSPCDASIPYEKPPGEIDNLIAATQRVIIFDNHHLAGRAQLGHLFEIKGDFAMAEYWLSRACSHTKYRGGSGGVSSLYGGVTSAWGWRSWKLLSDVLQQEGRLIEARKSVLFSLDLQQFHCIRGYECLPRFFP